MHKNMAKIARLANRQTHRHTYRHTYHNTCAPLTAAK